MWTKHTNVELKVPFNELQCKRLNLVVFDYDRLSKDDRMGQVRFGESGFLYEISENIFKMLT